MYKVLWVAPYSLHDLASESAIQARSLITFFTKLGIDVTVLTLPIFSKFTKECIDPIIFSATQGANNSFTTDGVHYIYGDAKTIFNKLPVTEQRSFLNLFSITLRNIKPDAVICADGDILSSTLLLEAHLCKIPTIFVLQKPIYNEFDFSLVDLILSTDPALSDKFVKPKGCSAVEIGPWCFDPLPNNDQAHNKQEQDSTSSSINSTPNSIKYGPLLLALQELNKRTLEHNLSGQDYQIELTKLEQKFSTELLSRPQESKQEWSETQECIDTTKSYTMTNEANTCDDSNFTQEVLIGHVEVQYALNQVLRLVLNAPEIEVLRNVRFIFNERNVEKLKSHYCQVMSHTHKILQRNPELLALAPNLDQHCSLSYEEFTKLPQVKITQGTEQFIEHMQRADLFLDISIVREPLDWECLLALSYGVPVITTAQKQLPCELNVGLGIHTLAPNSCENPLLLPNSQDLSPLIELVKSFLQTDKLKIQENCFKALQECHSLEQALRCYYAVLPYLKRRASLDPHVMLRSMFDQRRPENKQ